MDCIFRRRRKEARPGEIIAAALEVFVEKGFSATRLDDVAARAGVSKGTVYLYFKNKDALFKAVIEAGMTPGVEALEKLAAETGKPAAELLREYLAAWWRMMDETSLGVLLKLLIAESRNFPEVAQWFNDAIVNRAKKATASIVEAGIARGEFRPVALDTVTDIMFAPMFSYSIWRCAFGEIMHALPAPERFFEDSIDMLMHGLVNVQPKGANP